MQEKSEGRPYGTTLNSVSSAASVADDLPMKPPPRYLMHRAWLRHFLECGWLGPEWCLARIAGRPQFAIFTRHAPPAELIGKYDVIRTADITAVRVALGKDAHRLVLRALPTRGEVLEALADPCEPGPRKAVHPDEGIAPGGRPLIPGRRG